MAVRVTRKVFWDLAIWMTLLGIGAGIVFPAFTILLGVPASTAFGPVFVVACLAAGLVVALGNHTIARLVVCHRLESLSDGLRNADVEVRAALTGHEWRLRADELRLPVDSDDALGDTARSFNGLVESLVKLGEFRALVERSTDMIVVVDADGGVRFASASTTSWLGIAPDEMSVDALMGMVHPDDLAATAQAVERLDAGEAWASVPIRARRSDGAWRTCELVVRDLRDDPVIGGTVWSARDVTDRAELEAELLHQALHDPLTGLANRHLFGERVSHALTGRDAGTLAVMYVDLDDFKTVNDSLGHGAGDRLLLSVAERLTATVRAGDTAARLGGDEFAVLVERSAGRDAVLEVAERIRAALAEPTDIGSIQLAANASIGIAFADDGAEVPDAEELIRNADIAMYMAKASGKHRQAVYEPSMHAAARRRLELKADLARAVAADELFLEYQPILDLDTGETTGFEALIRWRHPSRGLIGPADFIPLAEESGAIITIGDWVLHRACQQMREWQHRHPERPLRLSVNVSGVQLRDADVVASVASALEASGLEPSSLLLELTETVLLADVESVRSVLAELKALGVTIGIDDFGTGYSSFSYLRDYPIDVVKIDRSFVGDLDVGVHTAMVRSILRLAESLGIDGVAEGIESEAVRAALVQLGCHAGQGYHFAHPLDARDVDAHLDRTQHGVRAV
ncbi:MAG: EAL domain-containing protein [Actinomycetota bacterium]|nr:EAL domain-containing protein [Actinomycetota bacterium]